MKGINSTFPLIKKKEKEKKKNCPGLNTVTGENKCAENGDSQFEKPLNGKWALALTTLRHVLKE